MQNKEEEEVEASEGFTDFKITDYEKLRISKITEIKNYGFQFL